MLIPPHYLMFTASCILSSISSAEWIDCRVPSSFSIKIDNTTVFINDAKINVKYDRNNLAVYEYCDTKAVNILINNTAVSFSGRILPLNNDLNSVALKTSRVFNTQIAGTAQLMKSKYNDDTLVDCDLYLARRRKEDREHFPAAIQVEILHQAASCIRAKICRKLGRITQDDFRNAKSHPFAFGLLAVKANTNINGSNKVKTMDVNNLTTLVTSVEQLDFNNVNSDGLQSTVNILVDLAIAEIVKKVKEESQGTIKLPDINQRFTENSMWKPNGEFDAIDGTFSDLTTLSRTEDAHLSHNGLKFVASCGFGLSKADIHYKKYKLKYGIKVSGELWVTIDGIAMATSVAVDYNHRPCRAILQDLRFTKLGKLKIKMTGLGPLNSLVSKMVTWVLTKRKEQMITEVESQVKDIVQEHLAKLNCEKFRP